LDSFGKIIKDYSIQDANLKSRVINLLKRHFSQMQKDANNNALQLRTKLAVIQNKQSNLLNLLCEEKISQKDFDNQRKVYLKQAIEYDKLLK